MHVSSLHVLIFLSLCPSLHLVPCADEVVCQLFDCCGGVPSNHSVGVMGDEDSLRGFNDDNTFSALFIPNESVMIFSEALEVAIELLAIYNGGLPFWHTNFYLQLL